MNDTGADDEGEHCYQFPDALALEEVDEIGLPSVDASDHGVTVAFGDRRGPGRQHSSAATSLHRSLKATARVRRLHARGALTIGPGGGRYADPTLFRASTCALSSCVSDVAICTNSGQTTCNPAFCFPAPNAYLD